MNNLTPFTWYGGKTAHLHWLLPIIDNTPHHCYVEPFGGSAAVLLNKQPSPIEVYNDIYSDVVDFFRILRNRKDELLSLLELTPYSREEFSEACFPEEGISELERARMFFVRARQVRSGLATTATPGNWSNSKKDSRRGVAKPISSWLSAIDGLSEVCERLREVQIECLDAIDIVGRYDTEKTLHYIDPPYLMTTRTGGKAYKYEFSSNQHETLLERIKSLQGKVIISGYENELYQDKLNDWHVYRFNVTHAPSSNLGKNQQRQEVIWTNFPMEFANISLVEK